MEPLLSLLGAVPTAAELRESLRERLRGAWSDRWWKAPSSGRGGHQKVKTRVLGNHTSTYRVLQQARKQKKGPPRAAEDPELTALRRGGSGECHSSSRRRNAKVERSESASQRAHSTGGSVKKPRDPPS